MYLGPEEDRNELWQQFSSNLRGLDLKDIRLPQCPGNVLQAITESLPDLHAVQAMALTDPSAQPEEVRSVYNARNNICSDKQSC